MTSEKNSMPRTNCKNCENRGEVMYTNGIVKCEVSKQRVSLGNQCPEYKPIPEGTDKRLVRSSVLSLKYYGGLNGIRKN